MKNRQPTTLRAVLHHSIHHDFENGSEMARRLGFVDSCFVKSCPLESNYWRSPTVIHLRQDA
ncbi:MAG: hypothetical protein AAGD25_08110 [Cyanobacteria bacterium P01_F01_bin.150]